MLCQVILIKILNLGLGRTHGKGRVFYTASGHDERVWSSKNFQKLIKNGILWSVGENVKKKYNQFLLGRESLSYEVRENMYMKFAKI